MEERPQGRGDGARPVESSPDRLASVVKQLPAGVVLAEIPSGRIVLANDELERILGHGLLESPVVSEYGQWGAIHEDGTPYAPEDHPLARAVARGEVIEGEEVRYRRPDGQVRRLSVNAAPIREGGEPKVAVATFVDVTERRRAEEAQALLAEAGRSLASSLDVRETLQKTVDLAAGALTDLAMIYLRDEQGGFRVALGHSDPEVVRRLGGDDSHRPLPEDHPALEVMRTGETLALAPIPGGSLEAMILDDAHREVFAALGVKAVLLVPLSGRTQVVGAFGFVVTRGGRPIDPQLRATAEELGRLAGLSVENALLYQGAQAATRLREEVIAVVSHDLRNPLSVIQLAMRSLASTAPGKLDPRRIERTVAMSEGAVARMMRLIDDLLDVETIEARRFSVEKRTEIVSELVEESVAAYRLLADQASVELTLRPHGDALGLWTDCDRGRILQVLGNLLDNAIKYTPAGGDIEVTYGREGEGVRVTVADGGPGIPADHRERIFERFWQGDTRRPGSGLGLSIAKGIVLAHGGRIWVDDRAGGGAAFHVWLPIGG